MRRLGGGRKSQPKWFVDSFDKYPLDANLEDGGYNQGDEITPDGVFFFQSWLAEQSYVPAHYGDSTFNYLPEDSSLDGVVDGRYWGGAWVSQESHVPADYGYDSFNSYTEGFLVDEPGIGTGWNGEWSATPEEVTSYVVAGDRIEMAGSWWSGFRNEGREMVVPITELPAQAGDLLVLCIMRREAIASGLAGWALVADQQATLVVFPTINQWGSIYSRPFSEVIGTESLRIVMAANGRRAAALLVLRAPFAFEVQATVEGTYNGAADNPGLHPIQALVAAKDNSLGLCFSTCKGSSVDATYTLAAPWTQVSPVADATGYSTNRVCVGVKALDSGEDIAAGVTHAVHSPASNHEGTEISVVFQPV